MEDVGNGKKMNRQEEEFDKAMRAWYLKKDKKRKVKNGIKAIIAIILLVMIWGYSGYLILRTNVMYATTEWYEVEAYCESSVAYEKDYVSTERGNGKRKSVHKTETRYSNTYVVVLIIAGGMTFCILIGLHLSWKRKPRELMHREATWTS